MKNNITRRCVLIALGCTLVFFITYYGSIFFEMMFLFILAGAVNTALMTSVSFNGWASKAVIHAALVLTLEWIFQTYRLNEFIAEKINYRLTEHSWGELLTITNALWFSALFGSLLLSLGITAVIVYLRENKWK